MLTDSPMLAKRWVKIVPHINDSLLLLCAVGLMVQLGQYPGAQPWLTAKVIGLLVYIGLGIVALKPTRPKPVRAAAFAGALFVLAWMISVAISHSPAGFLAV